MLTKFVKLPSHVPRLWRGFLFQMACIATIPKARALLDPAAVLATKMLFNLTEVLCLSPPLIQLGAFRVEIRLRSKRLGKSSSVSGTFGYMPLTHATSN